MKLPNIRFKGAALMRFVHRPLAVFLFGFAVCSAPAAPAPRQVRRIDSLATDLIQQLEQANVLPRPEKKGWFRLRSAVQNVRQTVLLTSAFPEADGRISALSTLLQERLIDRMTKHRVGRQAAFLIQDGETTAVESLDTTWVFQRDVITQLRMGEGRRGHLLMVYTLREQGPRLAFVARIFRLTDGTRAAQGEVLFDRTPAIEQSLGAPSGSLLVRVRPAASEVWIGGRMTAVTPEGIAERKPISFGSHPVVVRARGFSEYKESVTVSEKTEIDVPLVALEASLKIRVLPTTAQSLVVNLDGTTRTVSDGRVSIASLNQGRHRLEITSDGFAPRRETLELYADADLTIVLRPRLSGDEFLRRLVDLQPPRSGDLALAMRMLQERPQLAVREKCDLEFTANRDCHLWLIQRNARDEVSVLYPREGPPLALSKDVPVPLRLTVLASSSPGVDTLFGVVASDSGSLFELPFPIYADSDKAGGAETGLPSQRMDYAIEKVAVEISSPTPEAR